MEKYRRQRRVVRLQTGLGATVHRATAGRVPCPQHPSGLGVCSELGGLQGTGVAAIATGGWGALPSTPILPQVSGYRGAGGFAHGLGSAECPGRSECVCVVMGVPWWGGGLAAL